jgi:protein-tyrosine phosphatase
MPTSCEDPRLRPAVLLPDELLVGPSPNVSAGLLDQLAALGVTAILSLQEEFEAAAPLPEQRRQFVWRRIPVADGHAGGAMSIRQLALAVAQIRVWREQHEVVYVHCHAGMGRAPTVAAAYLAATRRLPLSEAIDRVRAARACTSPTAQQLLTLAIYVNQLDADATSSG